MTGFVRTALAGLLALFAAPLAAAPPTPLFAGNDLIHLTIRGPIDKIARSRGKSATPLPATLTVDGAAPETLAITLIPRGITRRLSETCQFPPLRVQFPDKPGAGSLFAGQRRLKLVTHCRPSEAFQQYLLLEYSAYRMYQLLTPLSFGARLAMIDYVDAGGKPVTSRLGFFIEDVGDVAKRNGLVEEKMPDRVPVASLSPRDTGRAAMFEVMIGNLDWAMNAGPQGEGCCHNAKLIGAPGTRTGLVPVPYDFDFSGLVDAPYATPPALIKLPNVRVRRYRGFCGHSPAAIATATELYARQSEVRGVLDAIPQIQPGTKSKANAYLDGFFRQVGTPQAVKDGFLKTCL